MQIVAFDFATKQERSLDADAGSFAVEPGRFYWLTAGPDGQARLPDILSRLGAAPAATALLQVPAQDAQFELLDGAIFFTLSEVRLEAGALKSEPLAFLLGPNYLAAAVPAVSPLMDRIRQVYREDFRKFAQSSGFLLYELGSRLLDSHRRAYQHFAAAAERVQLRLFGPVSDDIFAEVAALTGNLLAFHRAALCARDLFNELATRKSVFVPESTQPALDILAGRLDRLGDDIANIRGALTETLNLYMGMVGHRTNRIVTRLTILSMIFLPLSFLAGVYGMNFEHLPELRWRFAYPAFWLLVASFVTTFVVFARRKKWI